MQIHDSGRPNDCLSIETMYDYFYGGSDDDIRAKQTEMKQVFKKWEFLLYPEKDKLHNLLCFPPRPQDFLFGMSCLKLKNNMHANHTDYSYLEVSSIKDTLVEYLDIRSFPWFQNYHNIFPIRSPHVLDYFNQGVSMYGDVSNMSLNGLSFEEYKNNMYQKVICEEQWTRQ